MSLRLVTEILEFIKFTKMEMKHGRRRHVILLCTDQTKNSPPKQAKVLLIKGSNSRELTLGKAAVSQGKLPGWVNRHQWSRRLRKGRVPETTPLEIARAYNSGRKCGFGSAAWLYIEDCGSTSRDKVPAWDAPQLQGERRARDALGPVLVAWRH